LKKNLRRNAENTELKSRVKKLEARLVIMEQNSVAIGGQLQNDNSPDNSLFNFNSIVKYHEKLLVDVKTGDFSSKKVCFDKQELIAEMTMMSTNSAKCLNSKLSEEKKTDKFLDKAHKKIISNKIK